MAEDLTVAGTRRSLLDKLSGVREKSGYWLALCPSHEDHKPSLSVREHDDGVSVKCHVGCTTEEILAAVGMKPQNLRPGSRVDTSKPSKESKYYYYEDADGNPLFRVWRTPSKQFIQQRHEDGKYVNGLGGIRPVLYRLPELRDAKPDEPVFVVEGEKDADRLATEGLIATTSPMGAGKWRNEYAEALEGRKVYVIPDNDKPGEDHAKRVLDSVTSARRLSLPGLPFKGDVSDWLDMGHEAGDLLDLAETHSGDSEDVATNGHHPHRLATFTLKELIDKEFPPIKWIVPGLLPEGTMLLAGKPKMGKSWMALGLCVSVATGTPALGSFEVEQGDALYLALEDNERRLKERSVKVLGSFAEANHHLYMTTVSGRLDTDLLAELEDWLETHDEARLVVIDTVARVRAKGSNQRSLYEQDYEVGAELTTLAGRYGVAIVLVHHLKKGDADDPMDLISGSTGLTAGVDGAMVLNRTRSAADAVLKAVHRELKDDPEIALKWNADEGRWKYLGSAEEYTMGKERKEILDILARYDKEMRPAEVADEIGKDPKTIARTMQRMRDDGYLTTHNYGKYEINPHADVQDTSASVTVGCGSSRSGRTDVLKPEVEVRQYDRYDSSGTDEEGWIS